MKKFIFVLFAVVCLCSCERKVSVSYIVEDKEYIRKIISSDDFYVRVRKIKTNEKYVWNDKMLYLSYNVGDTVTINYVF